MEVHSIVVSTVAITVIPLRVSDLRNAMEALRSELPGVIRVAPEALPGNDIIQPQAI